MPRPDQVAGSWLMPWSLTAETFARGVCAPFAFALSFLNPDGLKPGRLDSPLVRGAPCSTSFLQPRRFAITRACAAAGSSRRFSRLPLLLSSGWLGPAPAGVGSCGTLSFDLPTKRGRTLLRRRSSIAGLKGCRVALDGLAPSRHPPKLCVSRWMKYATKNIQGQALKNIPCVFLIGY